MMFHLPSVGRAFVVVFLAALVATVRSAGVSPVAAVTVDGFVESAEGESLDKIITVRLEGDASATTTTQKNGSFQFQGLVAGGNYTFSADSIQVTNGQQSDTVNF